MGFKEFFKPNKIKIFLAFIFFSLTIIILVVPAIILLAFFLDGLNNNLPEFILWIFYVLFLIIDFLFSYLISCVFSWIFNKFRKNKET